ncbi:hypothetical protein CCAX7_10770 [Capsulimonas corticalis]|uniref:Uncharacterized protein n=1 Tax=Capsulimonas corticalis TaxID=2219043 RepID=A0A402CUM1_9BACT|nr:hypothetical protein [Capsulimonas corticalis]BDI29026.1 hypothetical protein CCAX7_10770 [Capsulimonas corticalis]
MRRRELPEFANLQPADILACEFTLIDAQLTGAREYGFASWAKLKKHLGSLALAGRLETAKLLLAANAAA